MVTTVQIILIVIAALIFLAGLFMVIRSLKRRGGNEAGANVEFDKNGIPIIPRHERNLIDIPDFDDPIAGETIITPDRHHLAAVIEEGNDDFGPAYHHESDSHQEFMPDQTAYRRHQAQSGEAAFDTWQAQEHGSDDQEFAHIASDISSDDIDASEHDAFSTLVSATDHLMPVIEKADEPAFTDNSPVLDQHLLAAADQDQNSPLNNAQDNINITILPEQFEGYAPNIIRGEDLLKLVDKFGLKYGAMNMFHRYENKDGTGILWFSMMGITEEGIAPFDLNVMPHTAYTGLVMFLSLPHPKALQGFDSMISIAGLMARELGAVVLDEDNEPMNIDRKTRLRVQVQNYRGY
ncbi:MAG: cell division protein ZipA C-terminal FtsZ-binding domain-containing protein [Psychrobacter sp.]|nr:cell division protein ZipA C-terminal FtsZ-binding domain-containing protein [Psychrobacter sp.]